MKKYGVRKDIRAFQFDPSKDLPGFDGLNLRQTNTRIDLVVPQGRDDDSYVDVNVDGRHQNARPGDWVVVEDGKRVFTCSDGFFRKEYEEEED